jgi:hypothetical protein
MGGEPRSRVAETFQREVATSRVAVAAVRDEAPSQRTQVARIAIDELVGAGLPLIGRGEGDFVMWCLRQAITATTSPVPADWLHVVSETLEALGLDGDQAPAPPLPLPPATGTARTDATVDEPLVPPLLAQHSRRLRFAANGSPDYRAKLVGDRIGASAISVDNPKDRSFDPLLAAGTVIHASMSLTMSHVDFLSGRQLTSHMLEEAGSLKAAAIPYYGELKLLLRGVTSQVTSVSSGFRLPWDCVTHLDVTAVFTLTRPLLGRQQRELVDTRGYGPMTSFVVRIGFRDQTTRFVASLSNERVQPIEFERQLTDTVVWMARTIADRRLAAASGCERDNLDAVLRDGPLVTDARKGGALNRTWSAAFPLARALGDSTDPVADST